MAGDVNERKTGDVILDVKNISLSFGGVKALTDISFNVREHEIRAIIGPNGAGKSSMLNCINGVYQPQEGQITRFLVLHKELDADDGEMTRTRKVKRGFINDKYSVLVDALYGGKTEQYIETQVKFEDGRTGSVSATLRIMDAKTFAPVKAAA